MVKHFQGLLFVAGGFVFFLDVERLSDSLERLEGSQGSNETPSAAPHRAGRVKTGWGGSERKNSLFKMENIL